MCDIVDHIGNKKCDTAYYRRSEPDRCTQMIAIPACDCITAYALLYWYQYRL